MPEQQVLEGERGKRQALVQNPAWIRDLRALGCKPGSRHPAGPAWFAGLVPHPGNAGEPGAEHPARGLALSGLGARTEQPLVPLPGSQRRGVQCLGIFVFIFPLRGACPAL